MICQSCGRPLAPGARFCASCGTPIAAACTQCGSRLPPDAHFCPACGRPAAAVAGATATATLRDTAGGGERERKVATILFADVVGYTGLSEGYDPELVQQLVGTVFDRTSREVERYEGTIEKFAGDAMLALFGVPQAHEDDAERAVRAALEMQAAMAELAVELRASGRPELQLRIGVETGEVLADLARVEGERDRLVTGDPVNTAARLQSLAQPGTIIAGPGTYASTREVVEYEELEPLELKGKALPVPAWRAIRVKARRGGVRAPLGLEAPLIGRDEELGLLKETVRRLTAEGRPHMVTVIGSAGVGKSRLAWELEKYLDGLPETFHWRKGRYLSYGQLSYGGLIEVIRADAGVRDDDGDELVQAKLAERLAALGLAGDPAVSQALSALLGSADRAPAPANRDDLFEAWRRYLEGITAIAPLVLVVEDIHWADEGSLDFIDFLARWAEAPILILGLARHELLERRPSWGGGIANSATIVLEPLAQAENEELLDALLPGSLPPALKERIVAAAEGNPLFSEELVRMLIDRGLARQTETGWELAMAVDELDIPHSIQALLAARLDSLPASEKRVTQAAAVVGRIFWDAVVAHVLSGALPELDRLLRGLRVKELVVQREPSSLADSREFGFRHVLIRDVAYESVPKSERAERHLQVARWAEERLSAREDELTELLASHYRSALAYREEAWTGDEAGLRELRRRVLDVALRAARRSADLWQGATASDWFRVAIEQASKLDLPPLERARLAAEYLDAAIDSEPVERALAVGREALLALASDGAADEAAIPVMGRIQAYMAQLIHATGRSHEARTMLEAALQGLDAGPPTETRARLRWRLGWLTWRAFSATDAVAILERAVADARAVGSPHIERRAIHDLGTAHEYAGHIAEAIELATKSMEMARAAGDRELLLRCYINIPSLLLNATWDVQRADEMMREGLQLARRGGQVLTVCYLANNLAESYTQRGQLALALEIMAEARVAATRLGDANVTSMVAVAMPQLLARFGRHDEAADWWREAQQHASAEPQQGPAEWQTRALLRWPADRSAALAELASELGPAQEDRETVILLGRMALRTGQTDDVRDVARVDAAPAEAPRHVAMERWLTALLAAPSGQSVETLREVAQDYRAASLLLPAAEALADAALLAARASLPEAAELAAGSRELYEQCGAVPILDGSLEGIGADPVAAT